MCTKPWDYDPGIKYRLHRVMRLMRRRSSWLLGWELLVWLMDKCSDPPSSEVWDYFWFLLCVCFLGMMWSCLSLNISGFLFTNEGQFNRKIDGSTSSASAAVQICAGEEKFHHRWGDFNPWWLLFWPCATFAASCVKPVPFSFFVSTPVEECSPKACMRSTHSITMNDTKQATLSFFDELRHNF